MCTPRLADRRTRTCVAIPIVVLALVACAPGSGDGTSEGPTMAASTTAAPAAGQTTGATTGGGPDDDSPEALTGGLYSFTAGAAGTIALVVGADRLTIDSLLLNRGWTVAREDDDDDDAIDLELRSDDASQTVDVDAEIDDGGDLEVDVDWSRPAEDGSLSIAAGEAGRVTLRVQGDRVTVESIEPAGAFQSEREDDAVIHLVDRERSTRVEVEAGTDDGRLTLEIDTIIGTGFGEPDDDDDDDDDD